MDNIANKIWLSCKLCAPLTNWLKVGVNCIDDVSLESSAAAHANLVSNFFWITASTNASSGEKCRNARAIVWIKGNHALGVSLGLLDKLGSLFSCHRKRDSVAVRFAHLAAIKTRNQWGRGEKARNLWKHLAVALVKATSNLRSNLNVR